MKKYLRNLSNKFASKWIVFGIDTLIAGMSFAIAIGIHNNLSFTYFEPELFKYHLLLLLIVMSGMFLLFKVHEGIVRHTGLEDASLISRASISGIAILIFLSLSYPYHHSAYLHIPPGILIVDLLVIIFALIGSRLIFKWLFYRLTNGLKEVDNYVIFGAGEMGRQARSLLENMSKANNKVLFFIDEDQNLSGKTTDGLKVLNMKDGLQWLHKKSLPNLELILAIKEISLEKKQFITDQMLDLKIPVKIPLTAEKWVDGETMKMEIPKIQIEDLLERPAIVINNKLISEFIENKIIMITGAAGSIGSELVRQLLKFNPLELIIIDQAESPLYNLETELMRLKRKNPIHTQLHFLIKNVLNKEKMEMIFQEYSPEIIFHAAAYKHVPLMENFPYKAVEVNTLGTYYLANLAVKYGVKKFVFISTDKAVNPTNVMGASKRLAEIYVQSLNSSDRTETRFITTRFGNVLGSNGSVIPLFKKQIENGGPVTVTHKDIIRYFMTIPEACQLVLEAGVMGKGGEIFVFDMGEPVKIYNMAERMIRLSGFTPHIDIKIEEVGLRPGEKLKEELISGDELAQNIYHDKIMIAKVKPYDFEKIKESFINLDQNLNFMTKEEIVLFLKSILPEYESKNSPYEGLDLHLKDYLKLIPDFRKGKLL